jgi:LPXTG-motif cell wall-anchored protein
VQATFQCVAGQDYTILSGNGSVFQYGGSGTLTIVASGALGDFTGLTLNGTFLGAGNYDVSSGSTIVTLHHNYLASLKPGTYTLVFHYTNGRAQATFVIADKTAQTGDNDALAIFGLMAALSGAGLILLARRRKQAR